MQRVTRFYHPRQLDRQLSTRPSACSDFCREGGHAIPAVKIACLRHSLSPSHWESEFSAGNKASLRHLCVVVCHRASLYVYWFCCPLTARLLIITEMVAGLYQPQRYRSVSEGWLLVDAVIHRFQQLELLFPLILLNGVHDIIVRCCRCLR